MHCKKCSESSKYSVDSCAINRVLSIFGKKWAMPILLEMKLVNKSIRFNKLQARLYPITPKVLSARLREFEESELIKKNVISEMPVPEVEYELTNGALEVVDIIAKLTDWSTSRQKPVCATMQNYFRKS